MSKRYTIPDDVMNDIRLRMYDYDIADLSSEVRVSKSCLYAIRAGRTQWPRGTTFFALLEAIDLAFLLIDLKTGNPLTWKPSSSTTLQAPSCLPSEIRTS